MPLAHATVPWEGLTGEAISGVALPGEQLRYLRSQGLHENESFSDIARLFLPGAAVVLFLAAHLLQSGSRECCEEEEERAERCGRGLRGEQD